MNGPLVSVVMATRNAARYLAEALASVAAQTYPHYEIVVVDADSTDDTLRIAQAAPRVRVIRQERRGFADAWNQGIAAAHGDIIALLDSDDHWVPGKLGDQVDLLAADPAADGVVGRVKFFMADGVERVSGFRAELLAGDHIAYMPGTSLLRRRAFDRFGPFETRWDIASDLEWFARVRDLTRLLVLDRVVLHKRVHGNNLSYGLDKNAAYRREIVRISREALLRRRQGRP